MKKSGEEGNEPIPASNGRSAQFAIMFLQFEGHTLLMQQFGSDVGDTIISRHEDILRDCIERTGKGKLVTAVGDDALATFDSPSLAIDCALAIQRRLKGFAKRHGIGFPWRLRIGMHLGEAEPTGEIESPATHRRIACASRVMGVADGDQILTTAAFREAARGLEIGEATEHLVWAYHGRYELKGLGPTELHEVADRRFRTPRPPERRVPVPEASTLGTGRE